MADTYTRILVHCVFSTKARQPLISEPQKLWTYLRGIARNRGVDILAIEVHQTTCHALVALSSSLTIAHLVRDLKANSSRHLNEKARGFAWQDGYAAISVSASQVEIVRRYIQKCKRFIMRGGTSKASTWPCWTSPVWSIRRSMCSINTPWNGHAALVGVSPLCGSATIPHVRRLTPPLTPSRRCAARGHCEIGLDAPQAMTHHFCR